MSVRFRLPLAFLRYYRFGAPSPSLHNPSRWKGTSVGLLSVAVALAVSQEQTAQLDSNETPYGLYMWGFNRHGNVPFCRQADVSTPVLVRFFNDKVCDIENDNRYQHLVLIKTNRATI